MDDGEWKKMEEGYGRMEIRKREEFEREVVG